MALCKLLLYALTTNDQSLNKIMVKDDFEPLSAASGDQQAGYELRSKTPRN